MEVVTSQRNSVEVDGRNYELDVEARKLLVHFLRDDLDLTGTHVGCDTGNCGACSVIVNGTLVKSCMMLAVQADGATIQTVESLSPDGELLTAIEIPAGKQDGFAAVTLGVDGTCIANAAASIDGTLRIALGCVDAVPIVVQPDGSDDDAVRAAVKAAGLNPPDDVHASSEYRAHLAEVLAVRAARQAAGKGGPA